MEKEKKRPGSPEVNPAAEQSLPRYQSTIQDIEIDGIGIFPAAVIITDAEGSPIRYNQAAVDLLGIISPQVHPENWPENFGIYLQDGKTLFPGGKFPLRNALRGEEVETEIVCLANAHAAPEKRVAMSMIPLEMDGGQPSGALVCFRDLTDLKQSEVLRNKQARYAVASYTLSQQIARISNDTVEVLKTAVQSASETIGDGCVAALLNASKDHLKIIASHHINPIFDSTLHNAIFSNEYALEAMVKTAIQSGEALIVPLVDEVQLKEHASPEQTRYIDDIGIQSVMIVPIKGRDEVFGTLSLFRDRDGEPYTPEDQIFMLDVAYRTGLAISNSSLVNSLRVESSVRRITERALEFSEVRFQSIFTSTALGIKLLDLDGIILETNPAFRSMLEYSEAELIGKSVAEFWHPEDAKLLIQLLEKLKSDRVQSFQLEHRLLSKTGQIIWFNVTFTGIKSSERSDAIAFIVAIAENITDRKKMEAEMIEMKSLLHSHIEMERLQLAQELHDGPLQDLYSAIYKVENWGGTSSPQNPEKIEGLKQDLLLVVRALRNTAKNLRPPALANFGLEKAIRSHAEEFFTDHPEINLQLNLARDNQVLPEDLRMVLFRIYQNLMVNVLRHSQATEVRVRFAFDAEEAQLTVEDNGVGFKVPASWVELVRQGHFGLAGAVERVSLLGGTFFVDSRPGEGTKALVMIPIRDGDGANFIVGDISTNERY